jgi:hypothetical protein
MNDEGGVVEESEEEDESLMLLSNSPSEVLADSICTLSQPVRPNTLTKNPRKSLLNLISKINMQYKLLELQ